MRGRVRKGNGDKDSEWIRTSCENRTSQVWKKVFRKGWPHVASVVKMPSEVRTDLTMNLSKDSSLMILLRVG